MARYIDADKLIETIIKDAAHHARNSSGNYDNGVCRGLMDATTIIERFQTEDVAPVVHANWMPCLNKCLETTHYVCSKCKGSSFKRNKTKYCHNCGAKMLEE